MNKKSSLAALLACTAVAAAHATPIQVTQTFSNVTWNDYGVVEGLGFGTQPTGDWIFSGTIDSEAVDLRPDYAEIGMFEASNITLTQADLGLDAVGINNLHYLYFLPDRFGFDSNINFGSVWTRTVTDTDHFLSANTLSGYLALASSASVNHPEDGFGPQWGGFDLANGSRVFGWGHAGASTFTISDPTLVPEPGMFSLVLVAIGAGMLIRRRRGLATA